MLLYMCRHYTIPWYYNISVAILAQVRSSTKVTSVLANWYSNLGSDKSVVLFSNCPAVTISLLSAPHCTWQLRYAGSCLRGVGIKFVIL